MKTIAEVQHRVAQRLAARWPESVLAEAQGLPDPNWPWTVSISTLSGRALNERWSEAWRWIVEWTAWADTNDCSLTVSNRRVGGATREIPTRVTIPNLEAAAAAAEPQWTRGLAHARGRTRVLNEEFAATVTSNTVRSADALTDVDFDLARVAAAWFRQHDATGLTARQVPIVGLHAKWLDRNTGLVTQLSGRVDLGLVTRPSRIQFSYLDADWLQQGNRRRDSISLDEPEVPPAYLPEVILVTENKDAALYFPSVKRGIVIEGDGNAVVRLAQVPWVRACPQIVYWGDLDAHGLTILHLLRSTGMSAEPMFMDEATLNGYAAYASPTYADGRSLPLGPPAPTPFLLERERTLLERITDPTWDGPRRIEQERIPLETAHAQLLTMMPKGPL